MTEAGLVRIDLTGGNQPAQRSFMRDLKPGWSGYIGGLGSGKTFAAARKFVALHAYNGCPGLVVAPTYGDLLRFVLPGLTAALAAFGIPFRVERGQVLQVHALGQPIFAISGEHPERFAGFEVGHIWIDEAARIQASADDPLRDAPTQIRTRLRHPAARVLHGMISTTPEGLDTWVQRDWFDKPAPGYRAYIGSTVLNPALPSSYVEDLKASIPAQLVSQYLEGRAVQFVRDRAHPGFARAIHHQATEWDPRLPLLVGCDFNVQPMAWVLGQLVNDGTALHIVDEVYLENHATVENAVHAIHAKGYGYARSIVFHPDRAGKARSTTGDSEHQAITEAARALGWSFSLQGWGGNPPVQARINLVDRLISPAAGPHRLTVHPRCSRLTHELETTGRLKSGQYDPGPKGDRGHILDGLGYLAFDTMRGGTAPKGFQL